MLQLSHVDGSLMVIVGKDEPFAVQTDLGWSIVCLSSHLDLPKESSQCHCLAELPLVTSTDMICILETDFKDIKEERMKAFQDDILFLNKLRESIHKHAWTL